MDARWTSAEQANLQAVGLQISVQRPGAPAKLNILGRLTFEEAFRVVCLELAWQTGEDEIKC